MCHTPSSKERQASHRPEASQRCYSPRSGSDAPGVEVHAPRSGGAVDNVGRRRYIASEEGRRRCRQRRPLVKAANSMRIGGEFDSAQQASRRAARRWLPPRWTTTAGGRSPRGAARQETVLDRVGPPVEPGDDNDGDVGNDGAMYPLRKGSDGRLGE